MDKPPAVCKKAGQKLHLRYELGQQRIYESRIYPQTAPNGSTLIIYAHNEGLRLVWRGGRRRKQRKSRPNGILHSDQQEEDDNEWEVNDCEVNDPELAYPPVVDYMDIAIEGGVLHVEVPPDHPPMLKKHAVVAVVPFAGVAQVLQIPLAPPHAESKEQVADEVRSKAAILRTASNRPGGHHDNHYSGNAQRRWLPRVAIKFFSNHDSRSDHLVVASAGRSLQVWTLNLVSGRIQSPLMRDRSANSNTLVEGQVRSMTFRPGPGAELLVIESAGRTARIFDIHQKGTPVRMSYHTRAFSGGQQILGAGWILGGQCILAVLSGGEWGIWDTLASRNDSDIAAFALKGTLVSSSTLATEEPESSGRSKRLKLAPSTPGTHKIREKELFTGTTQPEGVADRGGVSVSPNKGTPADESVAIWYNSQVYTITSTQAFWRQGTSTANSAGFGLLTAPGMAHITDVDVRNENITGIEMFAAAGRTEMRLQRDIWVGAEHRIVILQARRGVHKGGLFQREIADRTAVNGESDQKKLAAGAANVAEIDRMLDAMGGAEAGLGAGKKVGFAK